MQYLGQGRPVAQQLVQAEANQQQQQGKTHCCSGDMPQAGAQAVAGTGAKGDDIDRAG
ncbi:hypothetical protein D3C72_2204480 [compost metagenome]